MAALTLLWCSTVVIHAAAPLPALPDRIVLATIPVARKSGSDWPRFLGPAGDSTSSEKGIVTPWPQKGLPIIWQTRVGAGYGMPAIRDGRLFQFDRHGDQARLTAMKAETGDVLWKFEYPTHFKDPYGYSNGPRCCPVVDGDRVYIYGAEGMLHCVGAVDGKLKWKVDTTADFNLVQNFFGVGSTPVVEGDLLITQVGGSPAGSDASNFMALKGNGSGIVAFEKHTGKVRYRITDELASYSSPVLATIAGRRWCFVLARGGLVAFEPASGKVDFHFPWRADILESVNASNPVVVGDRVFISETYGPGSALLKVRPGGYEVLWSDADKRRNKSMQCHWMTPIYLDGCLYGSSGRHTQNAELRCIDFATGKILWSEPRLTRSSLLLVDGHFVCLTEEGPVVLFRPNAKRFDPVSLVEIRGAGRKEPLLDYPCWAAPILSHGLLYLRGNERLLCLELIPRK
jgi:outer membrane protein assembly factor BamB